VTSDILEGLVAAGTLGLAGATTVLAFASRHATREAYRARADAFGPRVVVLSLDVDGKPVKRSASANASPPSLTPGEPWDLTQHGDWELGVEAHATLVNEGARTAQVRFEIPEGVEQTRVVALGSDAPPEPYILWGEGHDWAQIWPGYRANVGFIWWRSARQWAEAWSDSAPPPSRSVTMVVRDTSGTIEERCELRFGTYVLRRNPTEDGWLLARAQRFVIPNPMTDPVEVTGLMERTYPLETHWGWRRAWEWATEKVPWSGRGDVAT